MSFLCAKYGISVLCKGSRCYKGLSYQSSDTCNLYEIKASVIRDMLNTIEVNRLGNTIISLYYVDVYFEYEINVKNYYQFKKQRQLKKQGIPWIPRYMTICQESFEMCS